MMVDYTEIKNALIHVGVEYYSALRLADAIYCQLSQIDNMMVNYIEVKDAMLSVGVEYYTALRLADAVYNRLMKVDNHSPCGHTS